MYVIVVDFAVKLLAELHKDTRTLLRFFGPGGKVVQDFTGCDQVLVRESPAAALVREAAA